jgi:hypothetical protein
MKIKILGITTLIKNKIEFSSYCIIQNGAVAKSHNIRKHFLMIFFLIREVGLHCGEVRSKIWVLQELLEQ